MATYWFLVNSKLKESTLSLSLPEESAVSVTKCSCRKQPFLVDLHNQQLSQECLYSDSGRINFYQILPEDILPSIAKIVLDVLFFYPILSSLFFQNLNSSTSWCDEGFLQLLHHQRNEINKSSILTLIYIHNVG